MGPGWGGGAGWEPCVPPARCWPGMACGQPGRQERLFGQEGAGSAAVNQRLAIHHRARHVLRPGPTPRRAERPWWPRASRSLGLTHVKLGQDVPAPHPGHGLCGHTCGERCRCSGPALFTAANRPGSGRAGTCTGKERWGEGTGRVALAPAMPGRMAVVPAARSRSGFAVRAAGSTSWACP